MGWPEHGGGDRGRNRQVRGDCGLAATGDEGDDVAWPEAWLPEIESLYDERIRTHEALQSVHTDRWEKRWTGDDATTARFAKKKAVVR